MTKAEKLIKVRDRAEKLGELKRRLAIASIHETEIRDYLQQAIARIEHELKQIG